MKLAHKCFLLFCVFAISIQVCDAQKYKAQKKGKYDFMGPYCNGLAKVKLKQKWGYIDTAGTEVIPLRYNEVENFSDGIARVRMDQKWGLMSSNGSIIIKPAFDWIYEFKNGIAKVRINGQEYFMDKTGQRVQ